MDDSRHVGPSATDYGLPDSVPCPFCGGSATELHSPFGSVLSVATYWCRACRSPFEWVKWGAPAARVKGSEG
jgi:hypothetical protein